MVFRDMLKQRLFYLCKGLSLRRAYLVFGPGCFAEVFRGGSVVGLRISGSRV